MSMNRTLTQIQTGVGALFTKSLTDLVRGIRNNKDDEAKYISACVQEIKEELGSTDKDIKVQAIEKLAYLQMLGYPMDWAAFKVVECIAHEKWTHKRIGYLAACVSFSETTDVMLLITNLIRKDCLSPVVYEAGIALNCLSNICTTDLARDLVPDIVSMLSSSRPYIRKKAVLVMYKIFLKFPDALRPSFNRLKERLDDQDPSVVSAAVNVICELARKNARNYLVLAPVLYKLLTRTANNWMLIKIVKLFSVLIPLEDRLGKKLVEPLTAIINETNAMSLLYECIQTCIIGLSNYKAVMRLCVTKLRMFIEHPDQNLKYLGLVALTNIMKVFPRGIIEHRDLILNCLEDEDETIRRRAIELIAGMVDAKNLSFIVDKLKGHLEEAEGLFKDELLEKIIQICSQEKYKFVTDFEWYLGILLDLTTVKGIKNGGLLRDQILDVSVRVKTVREPAAALLIDLFEDTTLVTENPEVGGACEALFSAAWVVGEFNELVQDPSSVISSLLSPDNHGLPAHIQSAYLQTIMKLLIPIGLSSEEGADEELRSTMDLIAENLEPFMQSLHIEVQERACTLDQIIKILQNPEIKPPIVLEELKLVQSELLNPVSREAGARVKVPDGLDLDAWINDPMPEEELEEETHHSLWDMQEKAYAGSNYGGASSRNPGYNDGYDQEPYPGDRSQAFRPLDEAEITRKKFERNQKLSAQNHRYLMADDYAPLDEPDVPVKSLMDAVPMSAEEKQQLSGRGFVKPGRGGRGRGPRVQRQVKPVDLIMDDENPEGWVEDKAVQKPKEETPKDALSMVVLDASAESEKLPERVHYQVPNRIPPRVAAPYTPQPAPAPLELDEPPKPIGGTVRRGTTPAKGAAPRGTAPPRGGTAAPRGGAQRPAPGGGGVRGGRGGGDRGRGARGGRGRGGPRGGAAPKPQPPAASSDEPTENKDTA